MQAQRHVAAIRRTRRIGTCLIVLQSCTCDRERIQIQVRAT
jgi:hypothetical protein